MTVADFEFRIGMNNARFLVIVLAVAAGHILISVLLFTVVLAGIGAMTADESRNTTDAWSGLTVWNCVPIAINQHLKYHVYTPLPKDPGGPGWTQEQQIELGNDFDNRNLIRDVLFLIWPFVVGAIVAGCDLFLRRTHDVTRE